MKTIKQVAIGVFLLTALLAVGYLSRNFDFIDPTALESESDMLVSQAAIAQALFSVLAIFVAIWLGERQAKIGRIERSLDRERTASVYATVLKTQIEAVRLEANFKKSIVAARISHVIAAPRGPYVVKDGDKIRRRLYLRAGDTVLSGIEASMHFEKDSGVLVAAAIESFKGYNRTLEDAVSKLVDVYPHPSMQGSTAPPVEELEAFYSELLRRLGVIDEGCLSAEAVLGKLK